MMDDTSLRMISPHIAKFCISSQLRFIPKYTNDTLDQTPSGLVAPSVLSRWLLPLALSREKGH